MDAPVPDPASDEAEARLSTRAQSSRTWLGLSFIFGLTSLFILAAATFYYRRTARQLEDAAGRQLASIAELKVGELATLRAERMADAEAFKNNPVFGALAGECLREPGREAPRAALRSWLEATQAGHDCEFMLVDAAGRPRLQVPDGQAALCPHEAADAEEAMRTGLIGVVDLHVMATSGRVGLGFVAPLRTPDEAARPLGALLLRVNPERHFYPLLAGWPVPSSTAETLLVRRDGDQVEFLSNLRFAAGAALVRREPLTRADSPAAQAVLGREGLLRGVDYRGVRVLASAHAVPGTSWFLITRMDQSEVGGPQKALLGQVCAMVVCLLLASGAGLGFLWRREQVRHIGQRLQAADRLRESEERLRLALAAANQGIYDLDLQTGRTTVSPEYATMLGHDPAAFRETNQAWRERLHPDDQLPVTRAFDEYLAGRRPEYRVEYRQRTLAGDWRWILSVGKIIERAGDDRPLRMLGTHTDITALKAAEAKVQRLTRLYAALSQCNQAIVRIQTEDELFAQICRDAVAYGGMKMAWVGRLDESTRRVVPVCSYGEGADYVNGLEISVDPGLASGRGPTGVCVRDNTPVWCQDFQNDPATAPWHARGALYQWGASASLPLVRGGRPVGSLTLYCGVKNAFDEDMKRLLQEMAQDIGFALDNFAREAARKKAEARLRLLHTALQATPSAWMITDAEGVIEWVNTGFVQLTGYAAAEAVGRTPRLLRSGLQTTEFYRVMWDTLKRGEVWAGELQNRRKDGSIYREQMTIAPVRDDQGRITHFVSMKYDITERKQVELQLLRSQRMEGIGLLASGIAHDLNNVLAPILLSIDLLRLRFPAAEADAVLRTIEASARRGAGVVRQVLTFARGMEGERVPLRLQDVIRELTGMIGETFPRTIRIRSEVARDLPLVLGDATQLHQVLLNLAVNARDAMPEGGVLTLEAAVAQVSATASTFAGEVRPGPYVRMVVRDTGHGIPPEIIGRVFEPFFSTKAPGKGTGLGLSTVFGIVRSHGGFVDVRSVLGEGTEFIVCLPVLPSDAPAAASAPRPCPVLGAGRTILVCDDEEFIRDATRHILVHAGFQVICAADGTEALAALSRSAEPVALVMLDVMMPGLTGDKVAIEIRKRRADMPILFSTGMVGEATMERSIKRQLAVPATALLAKPYGERALLEAIARLLSGEKTSSTPPIPH